MGAEKKPYFVDVYRKLRWCVALNYELLKRKQTVQTGTVYRGIFKV